MDITELSSDDLSPTASILVEYWKGRGMDYSQDWAEDYIKKGHSSDIKSDKFFILKKGGTVTGCVSVVIHEGDVAEIRDFVVKEDCRSEGHGTNILESTIQFCEENNVRKAYALVCPRTQQFFKNRGFNEEGILKSHFAEGEDLVIMSRFLK